MRLLSLLFLLLLSFGVSSQSLVELRGQVTSGQGEGIENVTVRVIGETNYTTTDSSGNYVLKIQLPGKARVTFSRTGFISTTFVLEAPQTASIVKNVVLEKDVRELSEVDVRSRYHGAGNMMEIERRAMVNMPLASGNFESLLKTLPGVSTNNELSSQYSVRGGNFDENLLYINDVEVFRPMLVRSGQQEGLSFINPDLISTASFSAGGFAPRFGDKMSSVLDVRYGRPDSSGTVISLGLLGLSATVKHAAKNSYLLLGLRNKTNRNLLKSQPVEGRYQPQFYDIQGLYHLNLSSKVGISFWGDYNLSKFNLIPESRETTFGTLSQQFRLMVNYQGQEKDRYESAAAALTLNYSPANNISLKWINAAFRNSENETFDIEGAYIFDELNDNTGGLAPVRIGRGIGIDHRYGRNKLNADIYSSELRTHLQRRRQNFEAGVRLQFDRIEDHLNEFHLIDSAGYSIPQNERTLLVQDFVFGRNVVETTRYSAYIQNSFPLSDEIGLTFGVRANLSSYTKEVLISPRIGATLSPQESSVSWRISAGAYYQPPFYREMRTVNGELNPQVRAQRSLHFSIGANSSFTGLGTRLNLDTEVYYKSLSLLIPYKYDNVRIRYMAGQESRGYAAGVDVSLRAEFVKGLESVFRLSLMKTEEDIKGDKKFLKGPDGVLTTTHPGYLRRPSDQRVNFSAFFQDQLFHNPANKVHLTLLYGSALPVGPPLAERFMDIYKIPSYRRADIGFSKEILEGKKGQFLRRLTNTFSSLTAYAEVFNLLNINNTVSYLWIKDVSNNQFAVPNYLTSRQLNFKIIAKIKNK
ncbi:TonB-dependent receptor domain-containing protein [Pedobacter sp. SYSU D00535]|uniref:TonB-dependent receptor n=1 Tax=Pedobacter sp. SYSU D00535 TaxID=2810308 RepID=UPI001A962C66|nr:TonB-dependent receptor [Pedobacter sp. SYSU D00535]